MGRVVIVSGPPGAGKSTVARRLAETSGAPRAVHLHADDFYAYVRKGFVAPWTPEARAQNATIMQALAAAAGAYASDGYEVAIDGVVGPWFLAPWQALASESGLDVRYVVLMPGEAETVARATARTTPGAMTDAAVVRAMWQAFRDHPPPDGCAVDSSLQPAAETIARVRSGLAEGRFRLS